MNSYKVFAMMVILCMFVVTCKGEFPSYRRRGVSDSFKEKKNGEVKNVAQQFDMQHLLMEDFEACDMLGSRDSDLKTICPLS
ncbi:unnamed protein product [Clavelina lepadiformis]|uniref:Uncharacterized protein n=1 Tax=Clavelina lepadiformis TaxID=159417 RepID=A0ABP0GWQ4_CLALP